MHDVKYQLEETFYKALLLLFSQTLIDDLAEMGTASFMFKMKVLRTSVTLGKAVLCLDVYLPCCSDTLQAPKICVAVHLCCINYTWLQLLFSIF